MTAATAATQAEPKAVELVIKAPNIRVLEVKIFGTAPYMQHRFWKKAEIMGGQEEEKKPGSKKARKPRRFTSECEQSLHVSSDGWPGIPASAFRNACISACRIAGYVMTKAKLSVFCLADGEDADTGEGLVRIIGSWEETRMPVRNATGVVDIRARPMWRKWSAVVRLRYDGDQFSATDVMNLLSRAGLQVGIGEGRPDSKSSNGMGYGLFAVEGAE